MRRRYPKGKRRFLRFRTTIDLSTTRIQAEDSSLSLSDDARYPTERSFVTPAAYPAHSLLRKVLGVLLELPWEIDVASSSYAPLGV
jgi:hypothetical protein